MIDPRMDLPTDVDVIEEEAITLIENDVEHSIDSVTILGQLDPMEMVDGQPRWTVRQIALIGKANSLLEQWK